MKPNLTPATGRGLSPLPIKVHTHCLHGVGFDGACKRCERDIPRPRKARKVEVA